MPRNITLKGIPDEVYSRLKEVATENHRSLNSEIIARLEAQLLPRRTAQDQLQSIRALRQRLGQSKFDHKLIDTYKREGRV
jgi:plasmid stability protein